MTVQQSPQSRLPGYPLEMDEAPDTVRPFVQACGALYERAQVSLIPATAYDAPGMWLGDAAATAMDWQTYPPEVLALADRLRDAAAWRARAIVCYECWEWPARTCSCSGDLNDD